MKDAEDVEQNDEKTFDGGKLQVMMRRHMEVMVVNMNQLEK